MTTSTPETSPQDVEASNLDRRRAKAQSTKEAADGAQARVADIEARLATNATRTQDQQSALQRAQDEVVRLKRALKAAAKESASLQARRKKASVVVAKVTLVAQAAEAKYDKAVLADMVRREKDRDRAAAAATSTQNQSEPVQQSEPVDQSEPVERSEPVEQSAVPAPERPSATQSTATRTAARRTAAAAARPGPAEPTTNGAPGPS